jgi:hypothetical protein
VRKKSIITPGRIKRERRSKVDAIRDTAFVTHIITETRTGNLFSKYSRHMHSSHSGRGRPKVRQSIGR